MLNHFASFLTTVLPEGAVEAFSEFDFAKSIVQDMPVDHPELIHTALKEPKEETFTMSIRKSRPPYDKYAALRSESPIKVADEDELSIYEMVFGKDTKQSAFQEKVDAFISRLNYEKHRLGSTAASKKLNTVDGTIWTGEVLLGTEKTLLDVVFDNSSDWLVVEGVDCQNCEGQKYDPKTSTTSKKVGFENS